MLPALYSAVSGLTNEQTAMDVIGNNIANVNTIGFKASRTTFKEAFSQLLQGASTPNGALGGTDPIQIGSGMDLGSVDQLFSQGTLQNTGQNTDLAIQGNSFFVLKDGQQDVYTRAGNFQFDANGNLVAPDSGFVVQGINADANGNFSSSAAITDITISAGQKTPAKATDSVSLTGNLDQGAVAGSTYQMGITVYDAAGGPHNLQLTFTATATPGSWTWAAADGDTPPNATITSGGTGTATFSPTGSLATFTGGTPLVLTPSGGGQAVPITIKPGTINGIDGLAGFSATSNAVISAQDGYQAGQLQSININSAGVISGTFTNGVTRDLAQIALARFNNPSGLIQSGNNTYQSSANSGTGVVGFAGISDASTITAGALENSNVDISTEFTNMIVAERGFQANAQVITTANTMLQTLVTLAGPG